MGGYRREVGSERDMSYPAGGRQLGAYPAYPGSAQSRPPRPPLTKRMRPVHWIAIDCVFAGFFALINAATVGRHLPVDHARVPLALLFMVVVFVPVGLRRRAPVTAFGALVILGVLLSKLPPAVPAGIFLGAAFVLYTVTVEGRRRTGAAALGLMLAIMVFFISAGIGGEARSDDAGVFVPVALASVIAWMTGYSVRQRRLYVVTLQQQAANSAVAEERLRIARELHDVVAHSMSVIAVQAGYGQYVINASPDGAKDALGAIQATSRDALEEMRRMLGVLRQQDVTPDPATFGPASGQAPGSGAPGGTDGSAASGQAAGGSAASAPGAGGPVAGQAPLSPAPGLASLDRLVERTGATGVRVTLEVSGCPRPAPAGVDLSAYRIIQEALTNVVKHAGTGASCAINVSYTDSDLVIRVTDDGGLPVTLHPVSVTTAGTGHGIIGMRERVHLCGGSFSAGPLPGRGFQVVAALPLPSPSPLGAASGPPGSPGMSGLRAPGAGRPDSAAPRLAAPAVPVTVSASVTGPGPAVAGSPATSRRDGGWRG